MATSSLLKPKNIKKLKPKKSMVKGKFPVHQPYSAPRVLKVNKVLAALVFLAIVCSMLSYLLVIMRENKIKNIHTLTNKINFENIELQNKVDYLKSFYTIDNKVQNIDFLKKADKVLQVKSSHKAPTIKNNKAKCDITSIPGY